MSEPLDPNARGAPDTPDDLDDAVLEARETALVAKLKAAEARVHLLAGLVKFTEARWPFLEAEEKRRDPCAPAEVVAGRVRKRIELELHERGLDAEATGAGET